MLHAVHAKLLALLSLVVVWIGIACGYPPPDRRQRRLTRVPWYASDYVYKNQWEAGSLPLLESIDKTPPSWVECFVEELPRKLGPAVVFALGVWIVAL